MVSQLTLFFSTDLFSLWIDQRFVIQNHITVNSNHHHPTTLNKRVPYLPIPPPHHDTINQTFLFYFGLHDINFAQSSLSLGEEKLPEFISILFSPPNSIAMVIIFIILPL